MKKGEFKRKECDNIQAAVLFFFQDFSMAASLLNHLTAGMNLSLVKIYRCNILAICTSNEVELHDSTFMHLVFIANAHCTD